MNLGDELADSIKRAAQEAEILKARKRLEKLQAAGHDISNLKAAYERRCHFYLTQLFENRGCFVYTASVSQFE